MARLGERVHQARRVEAQRRIRQHRLIAGGAALAIAALLVAAVWAVRSHGSGDPARPEAAAAATTTSGHPAASTTTSVARRPAAAPPLGTTPDPASLLVLVDRGRNLPSGWAPPALVAPALTFAFSGPNPKRMLRPEAATAIDQLALAAARAGVPIIGVSAYRSEQAQKDVYDAYVAKEGEAAARTFSAQPGHSEHQTGLAIDVTGADGSCPAEPCFAEEPQAAWLAQHASEFGFLVRYPKGKELVTGYTAEPWHLRYVGVEAAREVTEDGLTLDEYLRAV
ncbi:M15 family metallopeptidase [Aquihabitans sp. McL0605]|uniref:M15 family metallopeptidase n=1 Tax=Aquihabitans sp. McL0605 TaxID=3415671 RepID=UPI003CF0A9D2